MKNIRWIIQNNLISENDYNRIVEYLDKFDIIHEGVKVIPFSNELPEFTIDDKINIYYGSTTFMYNLYMKYNPVGLFFNEKTFNMETYLKVWKDYMLNSEAKITTFKEFSNENIDNNELFFIRPDADDKSFNGQVKTFLEIKTFIDNATKFDNVILTENTKIIVSPPYNIKKEWRCYIVDGKVVTSSLYQKNFKLCKDGNDMPVEMIKFAEDRCTEFTPHKIFAMDIALCGDDYYIIECGCLNSVGLYDCNLEKLVYEISKFISNDKLINRNEYV